ncbi:MAG: carbon-nitrogen hydrolase family protein [Acidobacteria bacterium]|nr:carbon-nitrogen hydrolase family protein [Acidobacteriota bacterium]
MSDPTPFVVAGIQCAPQLARPDVNLLMILMWAERAREAGAALAVFPECAVSGYCFDSLEEAMQIADTVPGTATEALESIAKQLNLHLVVGMLERDAEQLFNVAVLVSPAGLIGKYRKIHLPYLGVDRFTAHGKDGFQVYDTQLARVGVNICYDCSFPESSRVMMLAGADLITLPTNWPESGGCAVPDFVVPTRALENKVYYVAVNRVGTERGIKFIGRSSIVDPFGRVLASADDSEQMLLAEIHPLQSRDKHIVRVPGEHEVNRLKDRQPDQYELLVKPK